MATRVFIDGAHGTTGLEIAERLAGRPEFQLIALPDHQRKDDAARQDALRAADVAILCLPDEAARAAVALAGDAPVRLIDASSAHRTAGGWCYGFPELGFPVAAARRVSNPGCYPTGFLALVAPLVRSKLVPADWPLSVNAVSGYSGGGRALIERFAAEPDLGWRGYGYALDHKHVPEMRVHAGLHHPPLFQPAVTRLYRGMVVEVPLPLAALPGRPGRAALLDALAAAYAGQPVVRVHADQPAELTLALDAAPSDALDLWVFADAGGAQARLVAVLDNLGKGAAGAAVQNLNLMAGLPATAGLILPPPVT